MSYHLWLDDCRTPTENFGGLEWVIVRNYPDFVAVLKERGLPEYTSLDHDLSKQAALLYYEMKERRETKIDYSRLSDRTGLDCLIKLMVAHMIAEGRGEASKGPVKLNIHSHNRFGVQAMKDIIKKVWDEEEYMLTTKEHPYKLEGHLMPFANQD
jgi:hypothetical protein